MSCLVVVCTVDHTPELAAEPNKVRRCSQKSKLDNIRIELSQKIIRDGFANEEAVCVNGLSCA